MDRLSSTDLARELAARRKRIPGICAVCRAPFVGLARRKYCSRRCADKVFYEGHKIERNRQTAERRARKKGQPDHVN